MKYTATTPKNLMREIIEKLFLRSDNPGIGQIIENLPEDKKEIIRNLKSDDIVNDRN